MNIKRITISCLIAALLVGCFAFSGCSSVEDSQRPASELMEEAKKQFDSGHYEDALKTYENLRDWYPFSPLTPDVELKIADSYYKMEKYEEAAASYEEFIRLHPTNKKTAYAMYQAGMCFFEQMDTPDRDQIPSYKASEIFDKLIASDPGGPYSKQASEKIKKCHQNIAAHEMQIAEFYYKVRQYEAALNRYERVVRMYPDVGMHEDALSKIKICREKVASVKKDPEAEKPIVFPSATQM